MIAASFWQDHGNQLSAAITLVVALAAARAADHAISRRGHSLAGAVAGRDLTPEAETRLRLMRRLIVALILLLGIAFALSQFASIKRLANGLLASSAIAGLVLGFAARQTLANAVAGLVLAVTQPLRIGDHVIWQGHTGTVENMRLTYTFIRLGDGGRLVIPNERLAAGEIVNRTILEPAVRVQASIWLPLRSSLERARDVLTAEADAVAAGHGLDGPARVSVAEADREAMRLVVELGTTDAEQADELAAELRERALIGLQRTGLLSAAESR